MYILGVRIDNLTKKEILEKIEFFLNEEKFHHIATVNPEFILRAREDEKFRELLNGSEMNIADGIGLRYAFLRFGGWLKCRWAGIDLMKEILCKANERSLSVCLIANINGLSSWEETRDALLKIYPKINFCGKDVDPLDDFSTEDNLNLNCNILLCNFGAPYQEAFINSVKNDSIRIAMGVGGSFDFITGKIKRAPKIMRILGLEWLARLFFQPWQDKQILKKRWRRVFLAVIVFPIKIILAKKENE
jgi:N-acetylglucosaminyldiphosphoundecaprenol N-acetyl-beta-D-mannosaminyltransferase